MVALNPKPIQWSPVRHSSSVSPIFAEYHRKRKKEWQRKKPKDGGKEAKSSPDNESPSPAESKLPPNHLLYTIPELVPTTYWGHRDSVREALERVDLAKRGATLKIPEFYVGSLVSVTVADECSPTKKTKFVGICTEKVGDHSFSIARCFGGF